MQIHPLVWKAFLNLIIIPFRKKTSGRLYRRLMEAVETETNGRPPLIYYTEGLADGVRRLLKQQTDAEYEVVIGMR